MSNRGVSARTTHRMIFKLRITTVRSFFFGLMPDLPSKTQAVRKTRNSAV
jgi:hypothetical protein